MRIAISYISASISCQLSLSSHYTMTTTSIEFVPARAPAARRPAAPEGEASPPAAAALTRLSADVPASRASRRDGMQQLRELLWTGTCVTGAAQ